jgi:plastocyanin
MDMPPHIPLPRGLACLAALTILAGCGGAGGDTGDAPARASVPIVSFTYRPAAVTVREGARVTWTNRDGAPHTATADDGRSFDTGTLRTGQSRTIRLGEAGTYRYHCTLHRFMVARVVVE